MTFSRSNTAGTNDVVRCLLQPWLQAFLAYEFFCGFFVVVVVVVSFFGFFFVFCFFFVLLFCFVLIRPAFCT